MKFKNGDKVICHLYKKPGTVCDATDTTRGVVWVTDSGQLNTCVGAFYQQGASFCFPYKKKELIIIYE